MTFDPEHRLVISVVVGKRTEENARRVMHEFRERIDGWPINLHEALTYCTMYSGNFCWCVRTLRDQVGPKCYRQQTPARAGD